MKSSTPRLLLWLALAAGAVLPLAARAQQPAVTPPYTVNLRAGPDATYPIVAVLPPRIQVDVYGCIDGYAWCDIGAGPDRGWVYAGNLQYLYQSRYVPLIGIASVVGIGLTAFAFDDYWGSHYRDRRFYGERDRWYRHDYDRARNYGVAPGRPQFVPEPRPGFTPEHRSGFVPPRHPHFGPNPNPQVMPPPPAVPIRQVAPVRAMPPQVQVVPVPPVAPQAHRGDRGDRGRGEREGR